MAGIFTAADIIQAAETIETRGEDFYQRLVETTEDAEARKIFEYLKGEEASHRALFHAMGERLAKHGSGVHLPAWANDDEYAMYMQSMLDNHALFRQDANPKSMTRREGIQMAMQFEKDTMLFFMEMKSFVPEAEHEHIERCIDEERKHLRTLAKLL